MTTDHHYGIHGWKSPFPSILKWLFFGYQKGVMIQTPETGVSASWVLLFREVGIKPIHPISCLPQKNMVTFFLNVFFGGLGWLRWLRWLRVGWSNNHCFSHQHTSTPLKLNSKSPLKIGHPKRKVRIVFPVPSFFAGANAVKFSGRVDSLSVWGPPIPLP